VETFDQHPHAQGVLMQKLIVQAVVDGVHAIALLRGERVTVLTDIAGSLAEVGDGRWDGTRFECSAWLGRDAEHSDMVHAAIEKALAATRAASRASEDGATPARAMATSLAR
jgi:hypothetical protein